LTDEIIAAMHPQTVAGKYQQAHRRENQRMRHMASAAMLRNNPDALNKIKDY
jgi:hypothetical protein